MNLLKTARAIIAASAAIVTAATMTSSAQAQSLEELYKGKTVTIMLGHPPVVPMIYTHSSPQSSLVNTFQATQKLLFNIVPVAADAKGRHFLSIKLSLMV